LNFYFHSKIGSGSHLQKWRKTGKNELGSTKNRHFTTVTHLKTHVSIQYQYLLKAINMRLSSVLQTYPHPIIFSLIFVHVILQ